jgi:hypothetical protein
MIHMKESIVKLIATLIFCLENVGQASAVAFAGPRPTPLRELSPPHTGPAPTIPPRIRGAETRGLSHRRNDPGLCGYVRGDTGTFLLAFTVSSYRNEVANAIAAI